MLRALSRYMKAATQVGTTWGGSGAPLLNPPPPQRRTLGFTRTVRITSKVVRTRHHSIEFGLSNCLGKVGLSAAANPIGSGALEMCSLGMVA
jgi:hypothetical protein